jgi:hypothetical protein
MRVDGFELMVDGLNDFRFFGLLGRKQSLALGIALLRLGSGHQPSTILHQLP